MVIRINNIESFPDCFSRPESEIIAILEKYGFEALDYSFLSNKLKMVTTDKKTKELTGKTSLVYDLIDKAIKQIENIEREDNRVKRLFTKDSINDLQKVLTNLDSITSTFGALKISKSLEAKYIKNGSTLSQLNAIKYRQRSVGTGKGTFTITLKKEFTHSPQYVRELMVLACFWVGKKGMFSKTNPANKSDDLDFYSFSSEVLSIKGLSSEAVFQKIRNNFELEWWDR